MDESTIHYPAPYEVIVIGAGHAGCEAALASARIGCQTLLLTISLDRIAWMPCNPAIGGPAKSQLVHEIDALGGQMGICADETYLQIKTLNTSKGPAVHSLRAQSDKYAYHHHMKNTLEQQSNLSIKEAMVRELVIEEKQVAGVITEMDVFYRAKKVVLATGTFLNGLIHIGMKTMQAGRAGEFSSVHLAQNLKELGFEMLRLKTGTPARVDRQTIDLSQTSPEAGNDIKEKFSFTDSSPTRKNYPCHLAYTNEVTHEIIRKNLDRSPLYQGKIDGVGPRYCPSIEDKVVRFADKMRHPSFLEPEGEGTVETYTQGLSSSLPEDVQLAFLRSMKGLEAVEVMRPAYAIEYDVINPKELHYSLETRAVAGLYSAGQLNGTSGYEEAAAQGLIAGINAALSVKGKASLILTRESSYIGTLIDDLITKTITEPYRMFTSRSEYRILLRQDNADLRLTHLGYTVGLINQKRYQSFCLKEKQIDEGVAKLKETVIAPTAEVNAFLSTLGEKIVKKESLFDVLKRTGVEFLHLSSLVSNLELDYSEDVCKEIEVQAKYEEYIKRLENTLDKVRALSERVIPDFFDYDRVPSLKSESRQKLKQIRPVNLAQASRIDGVTPADIALVLASLRKVL